MKRAQTEKRRTTGRRAPVTLVFGGARSGKSRHALQLAEERFRHPLYLATAEAIDAEMVERIALHKQARGRRWTSVEAPLDIETVILNPPAGCDGVLLDCITVWLGNVLFKEGRDAFERRRDGLVAALRRAGQPVIVVSNEVGMGIVPATELGRRFRDLAGWLNQDVAAAADEVIFVAAGIPMVLKGGRRR